MNAPVLLAQLSGSTPQPTATPTNLKLEKPANGQAVTVHLDGNTKLDFSDIASEKLTFVKVGEKLIVLFDNQSTVTIDPVFDSMGVTRPEIAFLVGQDRTVTGDEFAALFPITTDQSVLPAAGGNASGPSAGANFSDATVGALDANGNPLALLGDENFGGPQFGENDTGNPQPIFGGADVLNFDDEGLSEGNLGGPGDEPGNATSATGSLHVDFGTDRAGATFAFTAAQPGLTGLTSGGEVVHLFVGLVGGVPTIIGYVGADQNDLGNQVFTVTINSAALEGEYTFTLLRPLDHSQHGTEDTLGLTIGFSATDGSGDTGTGTINVNVNDDSPVIIPEQVDQPVGEGQSTLHDPAIGVSEQTGTLGISWGADRFNDHPNGGVSATNGQNGDRSVVFTGNAVTVTGHVVGGNGDSPTVTNVTFPALFSHGEEVHFLVLNDGTTLLAFTGDVNSPPTLPGTGTGEGNGDSNLVSPNIVFIATLSDDSNSGSYTITQYQEFDHKSGNQTFDSLDISLHYTATDSDGDPISGTLTLAVGDDKPTITLSGIDNDLRVYEDGNPGNPGNTYPGDAPAGTATTVVGHLAVQWGADNTDVDDVGGKQDGATHGSTNNAALSGRALYFTNTSVTADGVLINADHPLTSHGDTVLFKLDDSGTTLVGYTTGEGAHDVFTVTLSDDLSGSYTFTLIGVLDHPVPNQEDDIALQFNFTARDYDGDTVSNSFTVTVNDDAPVQVTTETVTGAVNENDLADFNPLYPLIFDFWQGSAGTSPHDGHTGLLGTVPVSGTLDSLVLPGADGPGAFHLISETDASALIASSGLKSHGDAIDHVQSINVPSIGDVMGFFASDGRLVFGLTVDAEGNYNFRLFDQLDHAPLAQDPSGAPGADANVLNIDLSQYVTYTDFDGDKITLTDGAFSINVTDDVPVVVGHETGTANENDLADLNPLYPLVFDFWQGSLGTSPFDGLTDDGSITGLLGTVPVYGFLADNIVGGADEFGKFDLVSEQRAETLLATLNDGAPLKSHGDVIDHVQAINIPSLGEAMGFFASDGRLVFGLFVGEGGFYNFRLFDQLDHAGTDDPSTTGHETAFADTLNIDLSKFVTFTDADGDTIDLGSQTFVISVIDDVPQVIGSLTVTLDESHLNNFLIGWDLIPGAIKALYPVEGSAGTDPGSETDLLLNTTSQQGFLNEIIGNNVVNGGADEFGKFGMVSVARADTVLDSMTGWSSKGEAIDHVQILDLGALGTVMGFFAGDRIVFTLTVNETGFYDLRLFDQLDHIGTHGASINLDLSQFVTYTDFDGDAIDLGPDHFVLTVLDDAPEAVQGAQVIATVEEEQYDPLTVLVGGDLTHGNEDQLGGGDQDGAGLGTSDIVIGSLSSLVKTGADENGTFSFNTSVVGTAVHDATGAAITSHGFAVKYAISSGSLVGFADANDNGVLDFGEHRVFSVNLLEVPPAGLLDGKVNDTFTFTLLDQIDHNNPGGLSTEDLKQIDLSGTIRFTDADGDTVTFAAGSFVIDAIDDTPIQLADKTVKGTVEEEQNAGSQSPEMNHGNEDFGPDPADKDFSFIFNFNNETRNDVSGDLRSLVSVGADEVSQIPLFANYGTFSLGETDGLPVITSKGHSVTYSVADGNDADTLGDTLTATSDDGRVIFTLTIKNDGSTSGDYTFTLRDQIDHAAGGGENTKTLDLSSVVQFSDADGDTITLTGGSFTIDVIDDVPIASGSNVMFAVDEDSLSTSTGDLVTGNLDGGGNDVGADKELTQAALRAVVKSGADEDVTFSLVSTLAGKVQTTSSADVLSGGKKVYWGVDATGVFGFADENSSATFDAGDKVVFRLSQDTAGGSIMFDLLGPLDHTSGTSTGGDETQIITLNVTPAFQAEDFDHDFAVLNANSIRVTVEDDQPKFGTAITIGLVDEDGGLTSGNAGGIGDAPATVLTSISNTLNILWGADDRDTQDVGDVQDGAVTAGNVPSTASLTERAVYFTNAIVTGLPSGGLKSHGVAIVFSLDDSGTVLIGKAGNVEVITVSLSDDGTGKYTFTLKDVIDHPNGPANSEQDDVTLGFNITARDFDGDTATSTFSVTIDDDTPNPSVSLAAIVEDETPLPQLGSSNDVPLSPAPGIIPAGFFSLATTAAGFVTIAAGADGASATKAVALTAANGANLVGVDSGLTTLDGTHILLTTDATNPNLVVGKAGLTTALAIFVDPVTGAVSVAEYVAIKHPVTSDHNDPVSLADVVYVTVTDGDNDKATSPTPIKVTILDDGPTIGSPEAKTLDEITLPGATTAHGSLNVDFGSDGPAAFANAPPTITTVNFDNIPQGGGAPYNIGTYAFNTNQGIANHFGNAGQLYGTNVNIANNAGPFAVTTLSLGLFGTSNTGNGQILLTGIPAAGGAPITVLLTGVATTSLGSSIASFDLSSTLLAGVQLSSLKIEPVLPGPTGFNGSVIVDNVALGSGGGGIGDGPVTFANQASAIANIHLADQNGDINLATLTSHGQTLHYKLLDAVTLVGYTGAEPTSIGSAGVVFSVVLSQNSANPNGAYDFKLLQSLDDLPSTVTDLKFTFDFKAKDGDGDTATKTFDVTVHDSVPTIGSPEGKTVDEEGLVADTVTHDDHYNGDVAGIATTVTGSLAVNWNADDNNAGGIANRSVQFVAALNNTDPAGLLSDGVQIHYTLSDNNTVLTATKGVGGPAVFTVTLDDQTGNYTFVLKGNLTHDGVNIEDDISLNFAFTATDSDDDTTVASNFTVTVNDDAPVLSASEVGATNFIVNGQFTDNGGFSPLQGWAGEGATAIAGWTINGAQLERNPHNYYVTDPAGGGRVVDLDATPGDVSLTQTFATLVAGQVYTLAFDAAMPEGYSAHLQVYWNGVLVPGADISPSSAGFQQFSFNVTAAATGSNTLEFRETGAADNGGTFLANVTLRDSSATVDEDGLDNGIAGGQGDAPDASLVAAGSLGIHWGADKGDTNDAAGIQDGTTLNAVGGNVSALTGRAVFFTDSDGSSIAIDPVITATVGSTQIALQSGGEVVHYQVLENGTKIVAYVGADWSVTGNQVFILTLSDDDSGSYKFTLLKPLDHPMSGSEDDIALKFGFTARDSDGDTTSGSVVVTVDDDSPTVLVTTPNNVALVDGALLGDGNDFQTPGTWGGNGAIDTGGNLDAGAWQYSAAPVGGSQVELQRVDSGYRGVTSSNGNPLIDLEASPGNMQISQTLHGLTQGQGLLVSFEIGQAADGGNAKLEVFWNNVSVGIFDPPRGAAQPYSVSVTALTGDNTLTFREVGQSGDNTGTFLANISASNVVIIDETKNVDANSNDVTGIGGLFTGIHGVFGTDTGMVQPQYAQGVAALVAITTSFGADGPAAGGGAAYALTLGSEGIVSGLTTTEGKPISLFTDGAFILGRYESDNVPGVTAADKIAFALKIDPVTGVVSIAQYVSLDQPDATNSNDSISLASGALSVNVTVTDRDGDTATQKVDVSDQIRFRDDGPTLTGTPVTGSATEAALPTIFGNQAIHDLKINFGADGPSAHVGFARDSHGDPVHPVGVTSDGVPLQYLIRVGGGDEEQLVAYKQGQTADQPVFIVELTSPPNPNYIFSLYQNVDHTGANGESLPLGFSVVGTDLDGDSVTQSFTVNVTDDGPTLAGTPDDGSVTEDALPTIFGNQAIHNLKIDFGSDGPSAHLAFARDSHGDPIHPIGVTSDGVPLHYIIRVGGSGEEQLVAYKEGGTANDPVFIVELTSPPNPNYVFSLYHNLDHTGANGESLPLGFSVVASDFDGDSVTQNFTVNVTDDGPTLAGTPDDGSVTEDALPTIFGNQAIHNLKIDFGSDGPSAHLAFARDSHGDPIHPTGITSDDVPLHYIIRVGGSGEEQLVAYKEGGTANDPVFIVELTSPPNPNYVFSLYHNLDHAGANGETLPLGFSVVASDFDGDSVTQNFTIDVGDDTPMAQNVSGAMTENQEQTFILVEGVDFSFGADGGSITLGSPSYTNVPVGVVPGSPVVSLGADGHSIVVGAGLDDLPAGATIVLNVPYTVTDGDGDEVAKTLSVTVTGTNDAPVISFTPTNEMFTIGGEDVPVYRVDEGNAAIISSGMLTVRDVDLNSTVTTEVIAVDGGGAGYNAADAAGFLKLNPGSITDAGETANNLTWTFNSDAQTFDFLPQGSQIRLNYTIRATDEHGATDDQIISILITGTNDAPTANPDAVTIAEDSGRITYNVIANDVDPDGTVPKISGIELKTPGAGTVEYLGDTLIGFTPAANFNGVAVIEYRIVDDHGVYSTSHLTVTVTAVNDAPVAVNDSYSTNEDAARTVNALLGLLNSNDTDVDVGATLSAVLVSGPAHGTLTLNNDGSFVYTPEANYHGSDSFTYKANDGIADSNVATVNLTVTPVNDNPNAPTDANAAANSVSENSVNGTLVGITATAIDIDGDTVTYSLTNNAGGRFAIDPNSGIVSVANGALLDFETTTSHSITVQASDGHGGMSTANFNIAVTDVPEGVTINENATSAGHYAFWKDGLLPDAISFDATTLFQGSNLAYTVTHSFNSGSQNWSWFHSANSTTFAGDPDAGSQRGLYVVEIDAKNAAGGETTFAAFNVLGDNNNNNNNSSNDGSRFDVTANDSAHRTVIDDWRDNLVVLKAGVSITDDVSGGSNHDVIIGNEFNNRLFGSDGTDSIYGGDGDDYIDGGSNTDFLSGGAGNDKIYGIDGDDFLLGGSGNDILDGGSNFDTLVGGTGNDTLTGGTDRDRFVFSESGPANVDVITDFVSGNSSQSSDVIDVSALLDQFSSGKADHVRFLYSDAGGTTRLASEVNTAPAIDGDVTIQVNTHDNTWESVVKITDTGSNLTTSSDIIQLMLDHATTLQAHV